MSRGFYYKNAKFKMQNAELWYFLRKYIMIYPRSGYLHFAFCILHLALQIINLYNLRGAFQVDGGNVLSFAAQGDL